MTIDNENEAIKYLEDFFGSQAGARIAKEFVKQRFPRNNSNKRKENRGQFEPAGFAITSKGKNKKGKLKKNNSPQVEKKIENVPNEPRTDSPQTASDLSDLIFGVKSINVTKVEETPPPAANVAKGQWAKKPEIPKDDFVMPEKYRPKQENKKIKKKYRNINENSDAIILPGRHQCDCQVLLLVIIYNSYDTSDEQ